MPLPGQRAYPLVVRLDPVAPGLCLLCALAAYAGGWSQGIAPLILLGLVLEIAFWVRLIPAWRGTDAALGTRS